jgi:hypothetical protein
MIARPSKKRFYDIKGVNVIIYELQKLDCHEYYLMQYTGKDESSKQPSSNVLHLGRWYTS